MASNLLPHRPRDAHKGIFGTVMVVGGSVNFIGAPVLAAKSAYRIGVGLVQMAIPASIQPQISSSILEAIWLLLDEENGAIAEPAVDLIFGRLAKTDVLILGPGLGRDATTGKFMQRLLLGESEVHGKTVGFLTDEKERYNCANQTAPLCDRCRWVKATGRDSGMVKKIAGSRCVDTSSG